MDNAAFTIEYSLKGGVIQTNLDEDDLSIVDQLDQFTRYYLVGGLFWWLASSILIAVHRTMYKRRVVAISLLIAFAYILLIIAGIILLGFKFSEISQKSEVCNQALNVTEFNQIQASGNGITNFIKRINSPYAIDKTQQQLASLKFAVNSAYTIYQNRLVAIGDLQTYAKIKGNLYVKTLLNDFKTNYVTDEVLKEQYFILQDLWSAIMNIRFVYSMVPLQYWAYKVADTMCYKGQIFDLFAQGSLGLMIVGVFFGFLMAWNSEYILRCIIFEEKSNIDLNKNRFDWT